MHPMPDSHTLLFVLATNPNADPDHIIDAHRVPNPVGSRLDVRSFCIDRFRSFAGLEENDSAIGSG